MGHAISCLSLLEVLVIQRSSRQQGGSQFTCMTALIHTLRLDFMSRHIVESTVFGFGSSEHYVDISYYIILNFTKGITASMSQCEIA